jgi:tetratricopeptide (TPR) repeat protein
MKELEEKNYKKAEHLCKEFLITFPKSYSMRCILAYTYRCLNNYEQAHLYLNEVIKLKVKKPDALYIRGKNHLRQGNYNDAVKDLMSPINYNAKINNLYTMIGISYYIWCTVWIKSAKIPKFNFFEILNFRNFLIRRIS